MLISPVATAGEQHRKGLPIVSLRGNLGISLLHGADRRGVDPVRVRFEKDLGVASAHSG